MDRPDRPRRSAGRSVERVRQGLQYFWETAALRVAPADGVLTARVVGEFSAGKTRVLRELIGESVPVDLLPISSLERQTRMQLEITYGSSAKLTVIERARDEVIGSDALEAFDSFPARHELDRFDPMRHRLRLTVPDERFVLANGDGYFEDGDGPKRLFLIDTPGWNSGDDALAEQPAATLLAGDYNLALVYVTNASRIDSDVNAERLRDFLGVLADAVFHGDSAALLVVVTRCPRTEAHRARERAMVRIRDAWTSIGEDQGNLELTVLAVDFDEATPDELVAFREAFWESLLAPVDDSGEVASDPGAAEDWRARALSLKFERWPVVAAIEAAHALLMSARAITEKAVKNGSFLFGMNRHRLRRRSPDEVRKKLHDQWHDQLGGDPRAARLTSNGLPTFDGDHPLALWWQTYWVRELESVLRSVRAYLDAMERTLDSIDADTLDIQSALDAGVRAVHHLAQVKVRGSFALLLEAAATAATTLPNGRMVATLLALSTLESHFCECHDDAIADMQRGRM